MTTHPAFPSPQQAPPPDLTPLESMQWLVDDFVKQAPGVTHALITSLDGLSLLASSLMGKDWADTVAASVSGFASLAAGTRGPGGAAVPPQQIAIERADCLFLIMVAGRGYRSAFSHRPERESGTVETVLGVFTEPDADVGAVGFEMHRLIRRFSEYMRTSVRADAATPVSPPGPR
ncbi:roadblock/LC7 domain-containing protein [Streptomyces broussonetiae]|uniref:Roadblock/LC7 domain-containing protein n=1 Tax=Streptomyces broussonetiae TaxID=2686304 RepID=A0ABV5EMA0_9ACTN